MCTSPNLPNQFDLARAPALVEERFERAVQAQDGEPTLARHSLNPVTTLYAFGLLGEAVDLPVGDVLGDDFAARLRDAGGREPVISINEVSRSTEARNPATSAEALEA